MKDENGFKPFIPADKVVPEVTAVSVILGILLAVLLALPMLIWAFAWV